MNNTKQSIIYTLVFFFSIHRGYYCTHFKRFIMRNIRGGVRNSGWFFSRRLIFLKIKRTTTHSLHLFLHNQKDVETKRGG
jgi:hypothetical protein